MGPLQYLMLFTLYVLFPLWLVYMGYTGRVTVDTIASCLIVLDDLCAYVIKALYKLFKRGK